MQRKGIDISLVIPARNEQESVETLYGEIIKSLKRLKKKYEIIFVDDGSTDKTFIKLKKIKK
ncbi:MAG: Glycosyl transferase family 2, partial [Candidatus Daviesbacteria bacterium GW2011_GWA1_36_8]